MGNAKHLPNLESIIPRHHSTRPADAIRVAHRPKPHTNIMRDAHFWIDGLGLQAHPEGGFFKEIFRSDLILEGAPLPTSHGGARSAVTSIYYLLENGQLSLLHRLKSDEVWNFHAGGPLTLHAFNSQTGYRSLKLGLDLCQGQHPQAVFQAGDWFGATVDETTPYTLVGCCVAPGFDYRDFELADPTTLIHTFPDHADLIRRLTHSA